MELPKFVRRYMSLAAVKHTLGRRKLRLGCPDAWSDKNDAYFMDLYKQHHEKGGIYALCAAGCRETFHHWQIFGGAGRGACIEFDRAKLEKGLASSGTKHGFIDYLTIEQASELRPDDLPRLPFVKRLGFQAEKEFRIVLETDEPQKDFIELDVDDDWILGVYLNPWLSKTEVEKARADLRRIWAPKNLSVLRSRLLDNDRWKRAGDRVAGLTAT